MNWWQILLVVWATPAVPGMLYAALTYIFPSEPAKGRCFKSRAVLFSIAALWPLALIAILVLARRLKLLGDHHV
jgi:hypothetical protein